MEPHQQHMFGEDFSPKLSDEQEKINTQEEKRGISILCVVFQLIIACLSTLSYALMPINPMHPPPLLNTAFINILCINGFFFIVLWFPRKNLKRWRKTFYSCLIFISTFLFIFFCAVIGGNAGSVDLAVLLIAWSIVALVDVIIYWLVKSVSFTA
jgi:presenilin-like A22 family membrane protease